MAVTILQNLVDQSDPLAGESVVDMRDAITMLEADNAQFTQALMRIRKESAHNPKVEWMEDQLFPRKSALAASATSAATKFTVTTSEGNYFRTGDVVRIASTGEAVEVTAVAASAITVTRSLGSVAAASVGSGVELWIVGNASVEGATMGTRKITQRVGAYNYCQIHRHPYGFTETLIATKQYGGGALMKERKKKSVEHLRAIEDTFFRGARDIQTSQGANSTEPQRFCGGLAEYISTNVQSPAGTMDKGELQDYLREGLLYANNPAIFASPIFSQVVSEFLQDNWVRAQPGYKKWGVAVGGVISGAYAGGPEVPVFVKRDWGEFSTGTANNFGSAAFIVDMDAVDARPLRSTRLVRGIQANDADEYSEEQKTEISLEVRSEKKHSLIEDVTG